MCTMHVFLGLVQVLDIWQLEGRSSVQVVVRSIHHRGICCIAANDNVCIPGDWGERPSTADFVVQCEEKKKHLGKIVSHMH